MYRPDVRAAWARANRLRRRFGFDRNVLRRPVDRLQWAVGISLIAVVTAIATPLSIWVAGVAYDSGVRAERYEAATRHQVVAKVLGPAEETKTVPRAPASDNDDVWVTWSEPDGTRPTVIASLWRADTGDTKLIWINAAGKPTSRPRPHSRTIQDTALTAAGVTGVAAMPFSLAYWLLRRRYDRRRYRQWDVELAALDRHRTN